MGPSTGLKAVRRHSHQPALILSRCPSMPPTAEYICSCRALLLFQQPSGLFTPALRRSACPGWVALAAARSRRHTKRTWKPASSALRLRAPSGHHRCHTPKNVPGTSAWSLCHDEVPAMPRASAAGVCARALNLPCCSPPGWGMTAAEAGMDDDYRRKCVLEGCSETQLGRAECGSQPSP